jgi:hypothetical protein
MLVTLSGITTLVRPVQPENAQSPMLVTLSGIVTLVRPVHPAGATHWISLVWLPKRTGPDCCCRVEESTEIAGQAGAADRTHADARRW